MIYIYHDMATYFHNIATVHAKHPSLPAILGNLDLDRAINAGDPLSQQNLDHARFVALALKGLCGKATLKVPFFSEGKF